MYKKEDLRYTLDRLYECRNLEISNLWQRSVFLSVFLILCFSTYGYILSKYIEEFAGGINKIFILDSFALVLSSVGLLFSVIWILMCKASKAWYEVYETAITNFESKYHNKLKLPQPYIMGNMIVEKNKLNTNLLSTKAGAFSPSRINIVIGQISSLLWVICGFFHGYQLINNYSIFDLVWPFTFCSIFIFIIGIVKKEVESGFLIKILKSK